MKSVTFHQLTYKRRAEDWIVAYEPTGSYALIDETGKEIIEQLKKRSVQATQQLHEEYDLEEFIQALTKKGLVYKIDHEVVDHKKHLTDLLDVPKKYLHWTQHPLTTGTILGIIATGIYALLTSPQLVPSPNWLYASSYHALLLPTIVATMFLISLLHELGHYATLKATGHSTGIQLMHRWYLLRPRVNLNNAQLLTKTARRKVYLSGIAIDLTIMSVALLVVAHTNNALAQLVALLSFLHALAQLTPNKEADLMRVASHQAGVDDITTHFKAVLQSACIFCKKKNDEFHRHAAPLLFFSTFVLATILLVYAIPFVGEITLHNIHALLISAASNDTTQFVDSLATLLLLSITAALTTTAQLRDHPLSNKTWFRALMTALFAITTTTTALLISVAITTYATPPTAFASHALLGIIYGVLLIKHTKHFQLHEYHIPTITLLSALALLTTLAWYTTQATILAPVASYTVLYTTGVLASSLLYT